MYKRNCPSCKIEIPYKSKYTYLNAIKKNTNCKKCTASSTFKDMHKKMKSGELQYGFSGKTHSVESNKKNSKSVKLAYEEGRLNVSGKNNGMYGKTFQSPHKGKSFEEIYGKSKAAELKSKLSVATSGENNPMYGKPSPQGSGNGWSGWYKDWYFRSLKELSYMVNFIERFDLPWKPASSIKIQYVDWKGSNRNYFPDFIIADKYLIEVKPKKLWNSKSVLLKRKAAEVYCKKNSLVYKLQDPNVIKHEDLVPLFENGTIKFLPKYEQKFKEYVNIC